MTCGFSCSSGSWGKSCRRRKARCLRDARQNWIDRHHKSVSAKQKCGFLCAKQKCDFQCSSGRYGRSCRRKKAKCMRDARQNGSATHNKSVSAKKKCGYLCARQKCDFQCSMGRNGRSCTRRKARCMKAARSG